VKTQAESLLSDLTSLRVGLSGETEAQRLIQRHRRYVVGQHRDEHNLSTEFRIENRWSSAMRLEPRAWMSASVWVQDGKVVQIGAGLFRAMDIFPTFGASAGMVVEDLENSSRPAMRLLTFCVAGLARIAERVSLISDVLLRTISQEHQMQGRLRDPSAR
jgi:hypothetical protein